MSTGHGNWDSVVGRFGPDGDIEQAWVIANSTHSDFVHGIAQEPVTNNTLAICYVADDARNSSNHMVLFDSEFSHLWSKSATSSLFRNKVTLSGVTSLSNGDFIISGKGDAVDFVTAVISRITRAGEVIWAKSIQF